MAKIMMGEKDTAATFVEVRKDMERPLLITEVNLVLCNAVE